MKELYKKIKELYKKIITELFESEKKSNDSNIEDLILAYGSLEKKILVIDNKLDRVLDIIKSKKLIKILKLSK